MITHDNEPTTFKRCIHIPIIKSANVALRFLLELCALSALGYWGFQGKGLLVKILLGLGVPLLAAVIWGMFGAPHSALLVSGPLHLALEIMIFGLPAAALYAARRPTVAAVYGVAVVLNRTLMFLWGQ